MAEAIKSSLRVRIPSIKVGTLGRQKEPPAGLGMLISSHPLRRPLVVWLYATAVVHLIVSVVLTWGGHSGLLDAYLHRINESFWAESVPAAVNDQQIWWLSLFGATLQSYSLYMLALVHLGNRLRSAAAWGWLIVGLLVWAPQDMLVSMQAYVWPHLYMDGFALLVMLPPLIWLFLHDRRSSAQAIR
jgi:hypothetical protein